MKSFLLFVFCLLLSSVGLKAQITLQSTDFALSTTGPDSQTVKPLMLLGIGLPTGGNNQNWDYSPFRDNQPDIYYYGGITRPAAVARPTVYASANLQMPYGFNFNFFYVPNINYLRLDATGYQLLGDSTLFTRFSLAAVSGSTADSLTFPAQTRLTNNNYFYKFPMTANSSWRNNFKLTTNFLLKVGAFGLNNTPGQNVSTISSVDTVIGWGTLKLRNQIGGTALNFNALLVSNTEVTVDSFFVGGALAPATLLGAFGLTQGATTTKRRLYFVGTGFKAPLFYVTLANNSTTNIAEAYRGILPNLGLTLINKNLDNLEVKTKVFPNPITEGVTFEFDKQSAEDWRVFVYNELGQIISNQPVKAYVGTTQHQMSFDKSLPNGTYFYQIIDDNSLIRNTGKLALQR